MKKSQKEFRSVGVGASCVSQASAIAGVSLTLLWYIQELLVSSFSNLLSFT